jgi:hypothetical protein
LIDGEAFRSTRQREEAGHARETTTLPGMLAGAAAGLVAVAAFRREHALAADDDSLVDVDFMRALHQALRRDAT